MAASKRDPGRHPSQGSSAQNAALGTFRGAGLLLAWVIALICGWKVGQQSDLLDAVLHGAVAWGGVIAIWMAGLAVIQRCIQPGPVSPPSQAEPADDVVGGAATS